MIQSSVFETIFTQLSKNQGIVYPDECLVYGWNQKSCGRKAYLSGKNVWIKIIYRPQNEKKGMFNDKLWNGIDEAQSLKTAYKPYLFFVESGTVELYEYKAYILEYISSPIVSSVNYLQGHEELSNNSIQAILQLTYDLSNIPPVQRNAFKTDYVLRRIKSIFPHVQLPESDTLKRTVNHGDFHWGNITADGIILDWENWGMSLKGTDVATLYVRSLLHYNISQQIYRLNKVIFHSAEGRLVLLYALAEVIYMYEHYSDFSKDLVSQCVIESKKII